MFTQKNDFKRLAYAAQQLSKSQRVESSLNAFI